MSKPVTLNVRIRGALGDFVMAHVGAEGSYENVSEYVRDLIRRDKERLKPSSLVASRQSLRRHSMRRRAAGRNLCLYATAGARPKADAYIRGLFDRSAEHTSELQSLMRISYAVFCLKKTKTKNPQHVNSITN